MKKVFFYALIFNLSFVFGQKINFKIENDPELKEITFSTIGDKELKSITSKENNFTTNYLGFDEGFYLLKKDRRELLLYLKPTDDLVVSFDDENLYQTLTFSGAGSEVNNYLLSKLKDRVDKKGNLTPYHKKEFYEGTEEDFLDKIDGYYKELFGFLFSRKFDEKFKDYEMKDLNYGYSSDLLKYQDAKKYYKQKDSLKPTEYFLEPLNDITFENYELYKRYNSYKEMTVLKWAKDIIDAEDFQEKEEIYESIRIKPLKEKVLEHLFFSMKRNTPEETDFYFNLIKKRSKNSALYAAAKARYDQIQYTEAEKNLSRFKFKDLDDANASLTDYKGKYIFVKIWVHFCKQCIIDLKELDMLRKKYSSEKLAFVGISVDKFEDVDKWKETVKAKDIKIPQLYLKDLRPEFFKTYDISQIPTFILLSDKGIPVNINLKNFNTTKTEHIIQDILKHK